MIIETNIKSGTDKLIQKINPTAIRDKILRNVSSAVFAEMKVRVHTDGIDSAGGQIGTYTPEYMKIRTGEYKYKGRKINRTSDTKVVISLTKQMETDFSIIHNGKDYGLGYKNSLNRNKVDWVENTYKKSIFKMTEKEKQLAIDTAAGVIKQLLNKK